MVSPLAAKPDTRRQKVPVWTPSCDGLSHGIGLSRAPEAGDMSLHQLTGSNWGNSTPPHEYQRGQT